MKDTKCNEGVGLPPGKWEDHFRKAGVRVEELNGARSAQARATILGNFLSQNQGREVPIQVGDRWGRARLRVAGEGRPRRYHFEITWDKPLESDSPDTPSPEGPAELDDGLGPAVAKKPEASPPIPPAPPVDGESPAARHGEGQGPPDRGMSANQEDWS